MSDLALVAIAVSAFVVVLLFYWAGRRAAKSAASKSSAKAPSATATASSKGSTRKATGSSPASSEADTPRLPSVDIAIDDAPPAAALPKIGYDDDPDIEPTLVGAQEPKRPSLSPPTQKIIYDDDAADDEPTHSGALILVTATAQTDKGIRRKRNEDSLFASEDQGIFVVADGMGGYRGGEIASQLAVTTIERAFNTKSFDGPVHDTIPPRASELARAIQMANEAIFDTAAGDKQLEGMGTTVCAARFSPNKQRLYIGHVGDSRVYRMRQGKLQQMTSDHTMKELGVSGSGAAHLSRAVGIWPVVPIDIVLGKPQPGDMYLLCSDGLSKMVTDDEIEVVLRKSDVPAIAVEELIKVANDQGGKDNVTVIVVRVDDPAKSDRPGVAA